jgi:hypothetical protein
MLLLTVQVLLPASMVPSTIGILIPWPLLVPLHPPPVADVVAALLLPVVRLTWVLAPPTPVTVVVVAAAAAAVAIVTLAALLVPAPLLLPGRGLLGALLLHVCFALLPVGVEQANHWVAAVSRRECGVRAAAPCKADAVGCDHTCQSTCFTA